MAADKKSSGSKYVKPFGEKYVYLTAKEESDVEEAPAATASAAAAAGGQPLTRMAISRQPANILRTMLRAGMKKIGQHTPRRGTAAHLKYGGRAGDHFGMTFTVNGTLTSDASGNAPYAALFSTLITSASAWSSIVNDYDLIRYTGARVRFAPLNGEKPAVAVTASVSNASLLRVWTDPDGALSAPSVTTNVSINMGSRVHHPRDFAVYEPFEYHVPHMEQILRQVSATDQRQGVTFWTDLSDMAGTPSQYVGGVLINTLGAGGVAASKPLFSLTYYIDVELVGFI